jgi:raffinose/stachyose/melibiose transport system permease protein
VLTKGGPGHDTEVMMTYIYKYFFSGDAVLYKYPQIGFGAAMAFVASLIIGAVTAIYLYTTRKMGAYEY